MGTLVRACEACRDAALAYRIPFISGKDSLNNQFTNKETGQVMRIPRTLLISAIGVIEDVGKCVTMDLKSPEDRVVLIEPQDSADLAGLGRLHRAIAGLIRAGKASACHDVSDGGVAVAAAEMCIASGLGLRLGESLDTDAAFAEAPGRFLVELADGARTDELGRVAKIIDFATVQRSPKLAFKGGLELDVDELTRAWRGTLDW